MKSAYAKCWRGVVGIVGCILLVGFISPSRVRAAVSSCTASVSPNSVTQNTSQSYQIRVNNPSSQTIIWVKVSRPSENFTINNVSSTGWNANAGENDVTLTSGSLTPATGFFAFYITATSGGSDADSANWTVQVSDDGNGGSPTSCSGSLGTAISGAGTPAGDTNPPSISDIVVSNVTDSQVTITWKTDENATTVVDYGTNDSYGSQVTGDASVTSHSVSISGLSANTTYHYDLTSVDGSNNSADSGDNTFVTAKNGLTGTTVTGSVTTTVTRTVTPTPTPKDIAPPRVLVTTDFSKPFTMAPKINGTATDPSGVASLEYSLDNGKSWLPSETIATPGKPSTTFEITPESLLDDNYVLKIRAADLKGNTGETSIGTLIIDRLPPRIGGSIATLGPQILSPTPEGSYVVPVGLDMKLTVSAVGGPTSIDVRYPSYSGSLLTIPLKKNSDNGLWSGVLRFDSPGTYTISAHAVDGAGNMGERDVATILAVSGGKVFSGSIPISIGHVTVYYLDGLTKQFVLWDGASYGQVNPQPLAADGGYSFYLPAGTYYIDVASPGYKSLVTSIFTLSDAPPVTTDFHLEHSRALQIGSWIIPLPDFRQTTAVVTIPQINSSRVLSPLAGKEFPYFRLLNGTKPVTSFDLRGKSTIITFVNTWMPDTTTQMAILNEVAQKKDINVFVIVPQETVSSVAIFKERSGYTMPVVADPDGDLVTPLNLHSFPTHIFVDRKGVITDVKTGVYNKEELFDMIIQ